MKHVLILTILASCIGNIYAMQQKEEIEETREDSYGRYLYVLRRLACKEGEPIVYQRATYYSPQHQNGANFKIIQCTYFPKTKQYHVEKHISSTQSLLEYSGPGAANKFNILVGEFEAAKARRALASQSK